jgi:hypothetical protein
MNHRFTAVLASALAASTVLAVPFAAGAQTSARSSVRTYAARFELDITSIGAAKGYGIRLAGSGEVALRPQLALRASTRETVSLGPQHQSQSERLYLVGKRAYVRDHGARKWTQGKVPGGELRLIRRLFNPVAVQAGVKEFGHVRRVGARHYRVTGDSGQVKAFLSKQLGLRDLSGLGLKTATINLWDNARHQPVKITLVVRTSTVAISAAMTIVGYNKHLAIRAPR